MKKLIVTAFISGVSLLAHAQDSAFVPRNGFRVAVEFSLLPNKSLETIQQQFQQIGVSPNGISPFMTSVVLALVRDRPNSVRESRLLFVNTTPYDPVSVANDKRSLFYGYGLGLTYTSKLVNTSRIIAGPVLGYDFMWYRLRILPPNPQNLSLGNIVANPAQYSTINLRQGFYLNLLGGLSADYRTNWLKRYYGEVRIGGRVGYQFPLIRGRSWRYGDGVVNDLPGFRSNNLFGQVGVTLLAKKRSRY